MVVASGSAITNTDNAAVLLNGTWQAHVLGLRPVGFKKGSGVKLYANGAGNGAGTLLNDYFEIQGETTDCPHLAQFTGDGHNSWGHILQSTMGFTDNTTNPIIPIDFTQNTYPVYNLTVDRIVTGSSSYQTISMVKGVNAVGTILNEIGVDPADDPNLTVLDTVDNTTVVKRVTFYGTNNNSVLKTANVSHLCVQEWYKNGVITSGYFKTTRTYIPLTIANAITGQSYARITYSPSTVPVDISTFDRATAVYFYVVMLNINATTSVCYAELYDYTASAAVTNSPISGSPGVQYSLFESKSGNILSNLYAGEHWYEVWAYAGTAGGSTSVTAAGLIIEQTMP
jgi:hypothetical protein